MNHRGLKKKALADPGVRAAYEALEPEFKLLTSLIEAREQAGLTQSEVARRMGTKPPAIARLESLNSKHSPSVRTLTRYAKAVGCSLEVKLIPDES